MNVLDVEGLSARAMTLLYTRKLTWEKNPTNLISVGNASPRVPNSLGISELTLEKNHINVMWKCGKSFRWNSNVIVYQIIHTALKLRSTLIVESPSVRALTLSHMKGFTMERNLMNITL